MSFQSQSPHKSVNLVRIPNKNTFSSAEIIERRIDVCPEASSRGSRTTRIRVKSLKSLLTERALCLGCLMLRVEGWGLGVEG
jgi:hypothetical protein